MTKKESYEKWLSKPDINIYAGFHEGYEACKDKAIRICEGYIAKNNKTTFECGMTQGARDILSQLMKELK